jgi:uncharacterized SAM-binding protein YcdF (DUF218 family)
MKVILILGAAVWETGPSPTLVRRTAKAFALWQKDPAQTLVPCGGLGQHPPSEAAAMTKLLIDDGVPPELILREDRSTNTFENIANAVALLETHSVTQMTIVTDAYHLPRAWLLARHFGIKPKLAAPSLKGTHIPTQFKQSLREVFAFSIYAIRLLVKRWKR